MGALTVLVQTPRQLTAQQSKPGTMTSQVASSSAISAVPGKHTIQTEDKPEEPAEARQAKDLEC